MNDRLFRLLREGVDGVDLCVHLIQHLGLVGIVEKLQDDVAAALQRGGARLLDAVDALDPLLDPGADPGLHFLRRGAQVGNGDGNDGQVDVGVKLDRDLA